MEFARSLLSRSRALLMRLSKSGSGATRQDSNPQSRRQIDLVAISANQSRKVGKSPVRGNASLFKPRLFNGRLELSSFCVDGLDDEQRWQLLDAPNGSPPIPVVGRAEILPSVFAEAGLHLDDDWDPERHVNVLGWPEQVDQMLTIRQHLVANHEFFARVLPPQAAASTA